MQWLYLRAPKLYRVPWRALQPVADGPLNRLHKEALKVPCTCELGPELLLEKVADQHKAQASTLGGLKLI